MEDILSLIYLVVLISMPVVGVALIVYSFIWIYRDAEARDKPGCLVLFLAAMFWPISFLVWLALRPPKSAESVLPLRNRE